MMNSLFAGVSGLRNHQIRMNVIGNNIANINTIGFKSSRVTFEEALAQTIRAPRGPDGMLGGINPMQSGLGVSVSSIDSIFTQGSLESTGQVTDLAVEGNGFFILSDGENRYYSRAGVSQFDSVGNLVNPNNGFIVQGMLADTNGEITSGSAITDIKLPFGQKEKARATTSINLAGNLDASPAKQTWTASSAFIDQGEIAADASEINNLDQVTSALTDGDQIVISGTKPNGSIVSAQFTYGAGNDGTTLSDLLTAINTAYGGDSVASLDVSGNLVLADAASGTSSSSLSLSFTDMDVNGSTMILPEFTRTVTGMDATHSTSIAVYDSLGEKHTVTITFTKSDTADALWAWEAGLSGNEQILQGDTDGDGVNELLDSGTVFFNTDGSLKAFDYTDYTDGTEVTSFEFSPGNGAENVVIELSPGVVGGFGGLIQFSSSS
ncbi:MAG: flagellar hook-basal body complex protein, partial [Candidatus Latescibacteria bacterium]|nr:flagellar hook-basal body complex protein [Candidatus Latescibacterota bacterium]